MTMGRERINEADGAVLVWIPGGEFMMGGQEFSSERPPHRVRLSPYWLGRTEVTNAMYRRFLAATGHPPTTLSQEERFNADDQPVVGVDWAEAAAYCAWAGGRLPTEAEWEFAARGTDGRRYPWGNQPPDPTRAIFDRDFLKGQAAPAGSTPGDVSPFGIFDMAGNVSEWVADDFVPYTGSTQKPDPNNKVYRGGAYVAPKERLTTIFRWWDFPTATWPYLGFRCAKDAP